MALSDPPAHPRRPSRRDFLRLGGLGAAGLALVACGGGSSGGSSGARPRRRRVGRAGRVRRRSRCSCPGSRTSSSAASTSPTRRATTRQAGFSQVDLVTGPVDSADALVAAGNVDRRRLGAGRHRAVHHRAGRPAEDHRRDVPEEPVLHPVARGGQADHARSPTSPARRSASRPAPTSRSSTGSSRPTTSTRPRSTQVVVQYDPTPLTEKKVDGFMAFLTNEPFLVKAQGFTPVTLAFADNGLPLASETLRRAAGHDRQRARHAQGVPEGRDPGLERRRRRSRGGGKLAVETYGKDLKLDLASRPSRPRPRTS